MQTTPIQVDEGTLRKAASLAASLKCSVEEVVRRAVERFPPLEVEAEGGRRADHPGLSLMKQWAAEADSSDAEDLAELQAAIDAERSRVGARRLFDHE